MISKAVLCHTLVIWSLMQLTTEASPNRGGIPTGVRSSMIANGWRPLTSYENKPPSLVHHPSPGGSGLNERHSGSHPVHGKLHEHMASSEKLAAKQSKPQDYSPPSILGSFSVFGHSVPKLRPNSESKGKLSTSETKEFSFLVPPPRDPVRYEIDPYRKVILRDNEAYLRQPGQYIISHSVPPSDIRNPQFFPKGGSPHLSSKNRPLVGEYPGGLVQNQQHLPLRQPPVPFESLKVPNTKVTYLQPPGSNGQINFASEQQASDTLYNRYPTPLAPHSAQLGHEGAGNFYSQVNHPAPYKPHALERDPAFLVHESHEVSYPTPASPPAINSYPSFRPSTPFDSLYPPERYSTARPSAAQADKFVPSKVDTVIHHQSFGPYAQTGNANLDNTIVSSEPSYPNGIANTYYISEQQSLTPPAPTWAIPVGSKVKPDINEVLPKTSRPPKFSTEASVEEVRQKNRQQIAEYLYPNKEQQKQQQRQQDQQQRQQENLQQHRQQENLQQQRQQEQQHRQQENLHQQRQQEQQHRQQENLHQQRQQDQQQRQQENLQQQRQQEHQHRQQENLQQQYQQQQQFHQEQQDQQQYHHQQQELQQQELQQQRQQELQHQELHQQRQQELQQEQPKQPQIFQQPQYLSNPLALANPPVSEPVYETPESISLKHFNEQQFKLQQQLLQRDRDLLREQELQRQQDAIDFGRITGLRHKEKPVTASTRPTQETPTPTVQYIDTTVNYGINQQNQNQDFHLAVPQPTQQDYQDGPFQPILSNVPQSYDPINVSPISGAPLVVTEAPEQAVTYVNTEVPSTTFRNRPRKPSQGSGEQQHRRRKPTTTTPSPPVYDEYQEYQHLSNLSPNPSVQSPGTLFTEASSTEDPTTIGFVTSVLPETTQTSSQPTTRPRTRRPNASTPSGGRRRRPTTTTTPEPETEPPVTYEEPELLKYKKVEGETSRRRRIKPSSSSSQGYSPSERPQEDSTTSTERKRYEIKNYGIKLGAEASGESVTESIPENETADVSQAYNYEQDVSVYTPGYEGQLTTHHGSTDYSSSGYPTIPTYLSTQGYAEQLYDHSEAQKNLQTNIPLEELFVNTERIVTTTPTTTTTTTTTEPTTPEPTVRVTSVKSTRIPTAGAESGSTRVPLHRMRPMRFGNTTRPRFSIKDYKSRLDYRNRMSTTTETSVTASPAGRHKVKAQQEPESEGVETSTATTGRYRHVSRTSHRMSPTTPAYHSRRTESVSNSTSERITKFTPKRRLHGNHLYRSKVTTSSTQDSGRNEAEPTGSTRQSTARQENVYSSAIRRRPQMKHSVYTQSSDLKSARREATEMIPEETSFYPSAISQLLTEITSPSGKDPDVVEVSTQSVKQEHEQKENAVTSSTSEVETSEDKESLTIGGSDDFQPSKVDGVFEQPLATTAGPGEETGQTEALVKVEGSISSAQLDEDLFAKASQSVADLTSSASALYDKPGMFKAVSVAPTGAESGIISSRFKIAQEKPTLPIEAFFQELSHKN